MNFIFSAFCYHCSRDLCLDHLIQHNQLINPLIRSTLDNYFTDLTNLFSHLESLTISSNILQQPFLNIEQCRLNAYRQIDELIDKKIQEIRIQIDEYRRIFDIMRHEQLEKIVYYKQKIIDLFQETQVTNKEMINLRKSIEQMKNNSNIFDKHSVEIISNHSLIYPISIRMQLNDCEFSRSSSILHQFEFRLKYIRLKGIVTCHCVLVDVNGTIENLIDQFIMTQDKILLETTKRNRILVTEVCQYRVRRRFTNDIQLKTIFNQLNELVLYETPFELNNINLRQCCLILCQFQDGLPWNIQFALPILLSVPRFQCSGRDLIYKLDKTIETYFPFMIAKNNFHYEIRIVSNNYQTTMTTILNEWADDIIDEHLLMADNATLIVNLIHDDQLFIEEQLDRLDGTLKSSNKRRK